MSQFEFGYEDVKQSFQKRAQTECVCLQKGRYDRYSLEIMEEWLNNYTTLLNVWFCEVLYYPEDTNLEKWAQGLLMKVRNNIKMNIPEIIERFDIKTIQFDGQEVWGVPELEIHCSQYMALRSFGKIEKYDVERETFAGQRTNLSTQIFANIRSNSKRRLNAELKDKYPFTAEMLVNQNSFSYHNIVQDEEGRESDILDLMVKYDNQIIRPVLVELGYLE